LPLAPSFDDHGPPRPPSISSIDRVRFSSAIVEEHRQLLQRGATRAGQHDLARRIIELQAAKRDGDQFSLEADEVKARICWKLVAGMTEPAT
jgi:hypothetical protein